MRGKTRVFWRRVGDVITEATGGKPTAAIDLNRRRRQEVAKLLMRGGHSRTIRENSTATQLSTGNPNPHHDRVAIFLIDYTSFTTYPLPLACFLFV